MTTATVSENPRHASTRRAPEIFGARWLVAFVAWTAAAVVAWSFGAAEGLAPLLGGERGSMAPWLASATLYFVLLPGPVAGWRGGKVAPLRLAAETACLLGATAGIMAFAFVLAARVEPLAIEASMRAILLILAVLVLALGLWHLWPGGYMPMVCLFSITAPLAGFFLGEAALQRGMIYDAGSVASLSPFVGLNALFDGDASPAFWQSLFGGVIGVLFMTCSCLRLRGAKTETLISQEAR